MTSNHTRAEFPPVCTHELFEQQAARTPDAVALAFGARQVSYRELNERANKVAHHLRERGVGPNVLVGVCLERSPEMVVALFGVWKAGGAYVPLDPTYPPERLSFMIGDAGTRLLLTEEKCRPVLGSLSVEVIYLDSGWPLIEHQAPDNPAPVAHPSHLAYVMYTSGSTGRPKGAMIVHSGLVNYLWWAIQAYAVGPGHRVPVHSSVSFDLTVTSLYTPLLAGGTVELLPEDAGAQNLVTALQRAGGHGLVKITPSHLELLNKQVSPTHVPGMVRVFVVGGENLLAESLQLWRDLAPDTRIINEYGPTETVVGCCVHEVRPEDPTSGPVPIGRPIANTSLYVLDPSLRPVPPGEMGELYIGGAGVASGYLNRPELTAERFLPDPFSGIPGATMYKTGDLSRYRADGILEYLGRIDDQVKIRGYRVELGEIEAALAAQPKVWSCAVLAREDESGVKQLLAYVVARDDGRPDVAELRSFLKERIPGYMIPAHFVFLDALPLTPNGKVDRKALPPWTGETAGAEKGGKPRTQTEQALATIWCDLLKRDTVGVEDDFFDLGGDSMSGIGLLIQIKSTFGVDLELAGLFDHLRLSTLAKAIDSLALAKTPSDS
ncbi:non-ribosomal peptide synthetase [Geothrix paludis]|uniref:non-ribosomal peptide synthetase n=1 Tax=Geothrix paludis TaxID=2922722 RepID=UPI001FABDA07|nr:non-ribosomal peptide synthetase [Geothrix paludis]